MKNNNGQEVSAKAIRRSARKAKIQEASKKFVPGSYDKLVWIKPKA